jgi:hypothetical protein
MAKAKKKQATEPGRLEPELVEITLLKPHPRNYRTHPEDQIAHLAQSIREHGLYRNIVVAEDWTILAGHGVVQAAESLGLEQVPVVRLAISAESPAALRLLAGDNEIAKLSFSDDRLLSELLKSLKENPIEGLDVDGLLGTGYDDMMLANLVLVTRPASEIPDFDAAAHWVGMPECNQEDSREPLKLIFAFSDATERERFAKTLGLTISDRRTISIHWPPKGQGACAEEE